MSLSLIAAVADNGTIGQNNSLPWNIPEDMERFKRLTIGKPVLMGRKTWESIPEKFRPLPKRTNIVITRQTDYIVPQGVEKYATIDEATAAHADEEIMVIGGAEIYRQTINLADKLYITHVNRKVEGDAFFPMIEKTQWKARTREARDGFDFVTYTKI